MSYSLRIVDLLEDECFREKLFKYGVKYLGNVELIVIFLAIG